MVVVAIRALCLSFVFFSDAIIAWSTATVNRKDPSIINTDSRREVLGKLGLSSAVVAGAFYPPSVAAVSIPEDSFVAYNIVPDAGVKLDPKLQRIKNNELLGKVANTRKGGAIWLGEHHNSKPDHDFQESFIRMLHQEQSKNNDVFPMAIGLEQVQVQFQPILDAYTSGEIGLEEMRQGVQWDKRWMWDFAGYRGVFEAARELKNVRLLALNVDSEDLALVEKGGYPNLSKEQLRKYIRDPVGFGAFTKARQFQTYVDYVIEPSYEIHQKLGLLKYTISGELLDSEMPFRNFLSGRILWDEGMATAAYSWVAETGGLLVGLVGADHVKFGNGIPGRFARLSADKNFGCTSIVVNPTLIDSRPSGSVSNFVGADSSKSPELITLQLRYLKDGIDMGSAQERQKAENTGGVLPFADYIVVT